MKAPSHHFKFERRFVPKVKSGEKRCTIRADRKRIAKPGEKATFSHWEGRPYASASVRIGSAVLTHVLPITIEAWDGRDEGIKIVLDGVELIGWEATKLATDDGFLDLDAMGQFFKPRLPFSGLFYEWEPPTLCDCCPPPDLGTPPA